MINERSTINITGGMDVFGSDGGKVGSVAGVEGDYVVVSKGFFFPTDYYIPANAINSADDEGVYLNVTKDAALNQGWDAIPSETSTGASTDDRMMTDRELTEETIASQNRADGTWPGDSTANTNAGANRAADTAGAEPLEHRADPGKIHTDDAETIRVPLTEEELTAQKREVDRGAVHVDKVVTEEQQELDVPVTEEHVNVSRRVVDREVSAGDTTFEEGTIDVPVHGEDVDIQKNARVREELEITKDKVQDTRHVTGTVRREEARVRDDAGNGALNDTSTNNSKKRSKKQH